MKTDNQIYDMLWKSSIWDCDHVSDFFFLSKCASSSSSTLAYQRELLNSYSSTNTSLLGIEYKIPNSNTIDELVR